MVFDEHIAEIEEKIGYTFADKSLLRQAFTRTSFCNEQPTTDSVRRQSNEVLEFFGDGVLSVAIITLLMRDCAERYEYGISTRLNEGDFSNIKSKLSDKKNLALSTSELGLQRYLIVGEGDAKLGVANEPSVMEDLFESIIGAIYIDSAGSIARVVEAVAKMLDVSVYLAESEAPLQSFKNAVQEWCADRRHRMPPPVYKTLSEKGPEHRKVFERACTIGGKTYGVGEGKNCKIADSRAAEAALAALRREAEQAPKEPDAVEAVQRLREIAREGRKAAPAFRDLGEAEGSTPSRREFRVECSFLGHVVTADGVGRRGAKDTAAKKMLALIEKGEHAAKNEEGAPRKKRGVQKPKN